MNAEAALRLSTGIVFLVGAGLLFGIWHGGKPAHRLSKASNSAPGEGRDPGWLFFSGAVLVWASASALTLFYGEGVPAYFKAVISTLNNVFCLLAASSLDYAPDLLKRLMAALSTRWLGRFLGTAAAVSVLSLILGQLPVSGAPYMPDLLFTLLTAVVLGFGFFESFRLRKLLFLAYVAVFVVVAAAYAQTRFALNQFADRKVELPDVMGTATTNVLLTLVFLSLAFSWAHEAVAKDQRLELTDKKRHKRWLVYVDNPGQPQRQPKLLTPKAYALLRLAAQRKKYGNGGGVIRMDDKTTWDGKEQQLSNYGDLTDIAQQLGYEGITPLFLNMPSGGWQLLCESASVDDSSLGKPLVKSQ